VVVSRLRADWPARQYLPLVAVFAATFGVGLIFGFQPPLMAFVLERGGASSLQIGAVTSASTIAVIACGPLYPRIIDRLGLRRAIVLGTAIAVAIVLIMPILDGVPGWVVLRFLTGCALGVSWIASEIWLNSVSTACSCLSAQPHRCCWWACRPSHVALIHREPMSDVYDQRADHECHIR
jgi:MFS family permease